MNRMIGRVIAFAAWMSNPLLVAAQALSFSLVKNNASQGLQPVRGNYVTEADTLRFTGGSGEVFVYRIKANFQAALPPMQVNLPPGQPELAPDSLFSILPQTDFRLPVGLYFAQSDTTTVQGTGFLVTDRAYPKLRKIDDVLAALVYLSTNEEIAEIKSSRDKKAALDNYWLRLGGNEENARRMIRIFYQRVEHANRHFTTYKEGWKTDMGMIYIIFGEPTSLNRTANGEEWEYRMAGKSTIRFTFQPKANQFTGTHYELVRHARYRDVWYEYVDRWRHGLVAN
ncbi:MAG: GWxTD domain-containing protein [Cytophagales bacterium]|nr:GWxTD domain-containing protein [Bernardetiaceae bacterium]MDW8204004.1 GWxTD domain-containing protein [Cytophagales bacterium]